MSTPSPIMPKTQNTHKHASIWLHLRQGFYLSIMVLIMIATYFIGMVFYHAQHRPVHKADAAIVLGAAAWGNKPSPVFKERINHAIRLYQEQWVKKLIFTGGTPKEGYPTEAAVGERYAIKNGIPQANILTEDTSRDTYKNLVNAKKVATSNDLHSFILVSDPFHMARAMAMAKDLDMKVQASPTPTSRFSEPSTQLKFILQESYLLFMYQSGKWFA